MQAIFSESQSIAPHRMIRHSGTNMRDFLLAENAPKSKTATLHAIAK
jgi:hypothetical protein